jgi:hypothetical protein
MRAALSSEWGRVFQNWESLTPDEHGFTELGAGSARLRLSGPRALRASLGILMTCLKEAPEYQHRRVVRTGSIDLQDGVR